MKVASSLRSAVLTLSAVIVLYCGPASAEQNAVAEAFFQVLKQRGATALAYETITVTDGNIRIGNLRATLNNSAEYALVFEGVALAKPKLHANGDLSVEALAIDALSFGSPELSFSANRVLMTEMFFPSAPKFSVDQHTDLVLSYSTAAVQGIVIEDYTTGAIVPIREITVALDRDQGSLPSHARLELSGLRPDLNALSTGQQSALARLGISELSLSAVADGLWESESGTLTVNDVSISAEDYATLSLSASFGGVTEELILEFTTLAAQESVIALDLLQTIQISSLSLRLENNGQLADILDMEANARDQDREALAKELGKTLERVLLPFKAPEFNAQLISGTEAFLRKPESFQLKLDPTAPVPVAQVMGTLMLSPSSLPYLLGATITANTQ
ncbi:hypothetical protein PUV47_03050 [Pseudovibrio exalbescens]|uniref:hypothetical protein n=1 Tax=Pseudovibrio exalbescens TaxID=197461 RepID=UPI0023662787|nr:hypothetical protein [Pseudovibrio exalbescens]MDD7908880.1 hypothetical protein [Pseudovibrio exalbescens]